MRPKSLILLALALGCGVVASIGITQVMAKRGADPAQPEVESILVAMGDIPMGDPVSAQMVKLEEWPKDKVPKGAIKTLEELENRRPKTRIYQGSPILDSQLLGKGMLDQGASDTIPDGMRVIAVKVDLVSGGASLIRPGDRVDLLVHLRPSGNADANRTVTKTILQDIKVFAVDSVWDAAGGAGEKTLVAKTISLLVTPSQAEKITMASEMGNVRLVMRSPNDKEQVKTSGTAAMDVLGGDAGSDRTGKSPLSAIPAKSTGSLATGLLGLLNSHKSGNSASVGTRPATPLAKGPEIFTVRILSGPQVIETVLESADVDKKALASEASFLHWKPASSAQTPDRPAIGSATPSTSEPGADVGMDSIADKPEKKKKSLDD